MSGYDFFQSRGWTPVQSAGIMGNLFGESSLNPSAVGDGGAAYGAGQWHPDRQADFRQVFGKPIQQSTLMEQYQFVDWELKNKPYLGGAQLAGATNVADATAIFMNKYERPANSSSYGNRLDAANQILSKGADIVAKGSNIINGVSGALKNGINSIPGVGNVAQGLGLTSDCGWICQFRKWLDESHFWQRMAVGVLALILIFSAFMLFSSGKTTKLIKGLAS